MGKTLVAYFSASGVTGGLAQKLADVLGADVFEIVPKEKYTEGDLNWRDSQSRSSLEMRDPASRPEMAEDCGNISEYDTVFIGFPIWWYVAPHIINRFLESHDFSGKTVIPFATSGGSGMGDTNRELAPSCPGAKLVEGAVLNGKKTPAQLKEWVSGLKL